MFYLPFILFYLPLTLFYLPFILFYLPLTLFYLPLTVLTSFHSVLLPKLCSTSIHSVLTPFTLIYLPSHNGVPSSNIDSFNSLHIISPSEYITVILIFTIYHYI